MTILRPEVSPSDIFLNGDTGKFVRGDGQIVAPPGTDLSGVEADITTLQGDVSTLQTSDSSQTTELSDHETRITTLEGGTSALLDSDFTTTTITSTSEDTITTLTVPGGSMAAISVVEFHAWGTWTCTGGAGPGSPILTMYFGGTLLATFPNFSGAATDAPWDVRVRTINRNNTAAQAHTVYFTLNSPPTDSTSALVYQKENTTTHDTASDRDFVLKVQNDSGGTTKSTVNSNSYLYLVTA